jgi:hypothetical protein
LKRGPSPRFSNLRKVAKFRKPRAQVNSWFFKIQENASGWRYGIIRGHAPFAVPKNHAGVIADELKGSFMRLQIPAEWRSPELPLANGEILHPADVLSGRERIEAKRLFDLAA